MDLNLSAFQEPRGVMRILHFVFSICAFATISGYNGFVGVSCGSESIKYDFDYPFELQYSKTMQNNCTVSVTGPFASDAKFFVATGVLAMLFALFIMIVYAKFDEKYKSNTQWPLYDFIATVIFGVLWISSSAAWANSLTGLKGVTSSHAVFSNELCKECTSHVSSFSSLNISVVFGFLNFFLWAADLWFLYKETAWFQGNHPPATSGV